MIQRKLPSFSEDMGDSEKPGLVDAESRREPVLTAFAELTEKIQPLRPIFTLHDRGTHPVPGRSTPKFNLMGRDISEAEYITLINGISTESQILIFGFPYSGRLVSQLSAPGRIILTSSSPNEGYSLQAGFGDVFVDAFSTAAADTNSDGAISLLEAFLSVEGRTKAWYEDFGTIQSEHPHLDDNGDRNASRNLMTALESEEGANDGTLAEKTFLGKRRSALPRATTVGTRNSRRRITY